MKVRVHMRVGKGSRGPQVHASVKPSDRPLADSSGVPIPTVAFAIDFDLPEALFHRAEEVIAKLTVPEDQAKIAAEVAQ